MRRPDLKNLPHRQLLSLSVRTFLVAGLLSSLFSLEQVPPATAATVTITSVTTPRDEFGEAGSGCSLREAIQAAITHAPFGGCPAGGDTANINLPAGYYYLSRSGSDDNNTRGDLDFLRSNILIQGAGNTVTHIYGVGDRVIDVHAGSQVTLADVSIENGVAAGGSSYRRADGGGGIRNSGSLTITNSTIKGNVTGKGADLPLASRSEDVAGSGGDGGGIYNLGFLKLAFSTVNYNTTGLGGNARNLGYGGNGGNGAGIYNAANASLVIYNSTIDHNLTGSGGTAKAFEYYGHAGNGGGIYNLGTAWLYDSTISTNRSINNEQSPAGHGGGWFNAATSQSYFSFVTIAQNQTGYGGYGGGIYSEKKGKATVRNTLIANNRAFNQGWDCFGELYSEDYNFVLNNARCDWQGNTSHNHYGLFNDPEDDDEDPTDPPLDEKLDLGSLRNNGGPTFTHALPTPTNWTIALNRIPVGVNDCGKATDQRGWPRPSQGFCDIGAYEWSPPNTLPRTGFAPDIQTTLPAQPLAKRYAQLDGLWLEIPRLEQQVNITGVPIVDDNWDLTWLSSQAGYLEGTAYPTYDGNTVLTAHSQLADGKPGPFALLYRLNVGNLIVLHAGGQRYVYQIQNTAKVAPNDGSALGHKEGDWLTLVTCHEYDPGSGEYLWRWVVQAVRIKVTPED